MRETGKGYRVAAVQFDMPLERVKKWVRVAKAPKAPAAAPMVPTGPSADGKSKAAVAEAARVARARTALAEALGPDLRRDLRNGVKHAASFLAAAPDEDTDWQQRAHAARALEILLARVPDLMTFDERTNPATTDADTRATEIGGVFGQPAASVTVLDGGRVAAKA